MLIQFMKRLIGEYTDIDRLKTAEDIVAGQMIKTALTKEVINRLESFAQNPDQAEIEEEDEFT